MKDTPFRISVRQLLVNELIAELILARGNLPVSRQTRSCAGRRSHQGLSPGPGDESWNASRILFELISKGFAQQPLLRADANVVAN